MGREKIYIGFFNLIIILLKLSLCITFFDLKDTVKGLDNDNKNSDESDIDSDNNINVDNTIINKRCNIHYLCSFNFCEKSFILNFILFKKIFISTNHYFKILPN